MLKTSIFYIPSLDRLKEQDGLHFSIGKYITRWRKLADRGRHSGPIDYRIINRGAELIAAEPLYYIVAGTHQIWNAACLSVALEMEREEQAKDIK